MNAFTLYTPETAEGDAKSILTDVKAKYGFVPNLFGYMAEAPYTIDAYAYLTDLLDKTDLSAPQQQVALLAVSVYNQCDFCTVAHRAFAKMHKAKAQTITAITQGAAIEDAKDKALVDLVKAIVDQRGWLKDEQLSAFYAAGFSKRNVYDLILIVTIKTLSNYANHLSQPEPNPELVAMV